ncbi:MAG: DUF342 domain-containing protein [Chitinivibrionales bacterium]|nr:DUF342 domain-containing protein [Chitinivibrionales bacterium]MBD3394500.1 DUF342 domain-containing protein [Chitinivibrionales bacterium]
MSNPLSALVPVEDRDDGVYISVTRELAQKLKLRDVINSLEQAGVINYDVDVIKAVIEHARGGYERIGEPFEYYNEALDRYLEIKVSPLKAAIKFNSMAITDHIKPTENVLRYCLASKGVCYGVKDDVIEKFIQEPTYDADVVVAEGEPPKNGKDGEIAYEVNINPDARPSVGKGGKADYREIQTFTSVKQGQVIARRVPPTAGEPGKTVTGDQIPASPGKDIQLPKGRNTVISEDGKFLISEKTGIVFEEGHNLHVDELLSIKSDVDFSVGNIKYSGNVVIKGNVMPGFTVEAEGDVEIGGEVESAKVLSRNGVVTIGRGVIGKGETSIYGKAGVTIGFAQNADLKTDGKLTVQKSCLHCEITCGALDATERQASIVGGHVRAFEYIEAMSIGNNNNVPTKIELLNKEKAMAEDKLGELEELKEKMTKQMAPVMREMKSKSAIVKKISKGGAAISDKQREQLKKIVDTYNGLSVKLKYIEKKIEEVNATIEEPTQCDGFIRVKDTIYPGVELSLYGMGRKVVKNKMTNKVFRIDKSELQVEG